MDTWRPRRICSRYMKINGKRLTISWKKKCIICGDTIIHYQVIGVW